MMCSQCTQSTFTSYKTFLQDILILTIIPKSFIQIYYLYFIKLLYQSQVVINMIELPLVVLSWERIQSACVVWTRQTPVEGACVFFTSGSVRFINKQNFMCDCHKLTLMTFFLIN